MKIENQCISLAQAKRLKELGIKQQSLLRWSSDGSLYYQIMTGEMVCEDDYAAFNVAELGVMLPQDAATRQTLLDDGIRWSASSDGAYGGFYKTEAGAKGALLIYLLEKKLITSEEVNQRLNQE
jgi:hypothetical protein